MSAATPARAPSTQKTLALLAVDFPPTTGGIQTLTQEIYTRLADLTRVVVAPALPAGATHNGDSGLQLPLIRTDHSSGQGWRTLYYLRDAVSVLRAQHQPPCLLHCNHLFAGYAGWWMRRRFGLPYVVWVHGEELSKNRHGALVRASLGSASAIFTNSDFTAALVRGHLRGPKAPPVHKIPLGTAATWWKTRPTAQPEHAPDESPNDRLIILTLARLSARDRYKGVDVALQAMAILRQRGLRFRYRIAGEGDDRRYLENLARTLGIGDHVEFLGHIADNQLIPLYDEADIFLLCSREEHSARGLGFEGFGIVFLEANARRKPVVAGRSGGIPDAVVDGETGILVDPHSPAAVADGLERLLRDAALRARLGIQGRDRVRTHFNWDEAAAQVRALHEQLCANIAAV